MNLNIPLTTAPIDAQAARDALLEQVAFLGVRPFQHQVVQSPWNGVIDAPSLHRVVKDRIRSLVDNCGKDQAIRCMTVTASAGYGKTHLLAWTRQLLDQRNDAVFVYVSPYTPGSPGAVTLEQHVMRATLEALWSRSRRQQASFEQAVRTLLVGCYDRIITGGSSKAIKETLRAGTFWSRLFRRSRLRIGSLGTQDQLPALQRAFDRRAFLEQAFAEFSQSNPVGADGVRPDWDAFVAACLLTCGNVRQRWHADRWFRADRIPPDVLQPFHLDDPCFGTEKIRNSLFTLQSLVGQSFCLAFDQLEDTYLSLSQPRADEATRFSQLLGILLRNLSVMPGFCLLFACQLSVWQLFVQAAPPMLFDRMVEGHGPQLLTPLDDATAQELVQGRLQAAVWSLLPDANLPLGEPFFPFTDAEIRQMRIETGGELRGFLQRAQQDFDRKVSLLSSENQGDEGTLITLPPPPPPRQIKLTGIEPREVMSHEETPVLIRGENFPQDVRVLFAGKAADNPPTCRPDAGEIDVTTPVGHVGDVEIRVEAADDAGNGDFLLLRFMERPVPRPYRLHIDGQRLRARRQELSMTQREAADRVRSLKSDISELQRVKNWQPYICRVEAESWNNAPDELYVRLAELYGKPLSSFLRQ